MDAYIKLENVNDIAGAMVLIHSIKKQGFKTKFIAITKIKTKKFIDLVKNFFDEIIEKENNKHIISSKSFLIKNVKVNKNVIKNLYIFENKPYLYEGTITLAEKIKDKKYIKWFEMYLEIINANFELYENEYLKETNEILKYFINTLSELTPDNTNNDTLKNTIFNLYKHNVYENLIYYHVDTKKEYLDYKIQYEPQNISFEDFCKKYKQLSLNDIYLKYLKHNTNTYIAILIDTNIDKQIENIFYNKKITITQHELKNILFNVNTDFVYEERIKYLNETYTKEKYNIEIIGFVFFENLNLKNENTIICKDTKINAFSITLNDKIFDFIKLSINTIDCLKYNTLKKWIFNNFTGDEIENIQIHKGNNYKIINKNLNIKKKDYLKKECVYFLEIYFLNDPLDYEYIKNITIKNEFLIDGLYFCE
jgi:hypothetical protein